MQDPLISDAELDSLAALAGLSIPVHCREAVRLHLTSARRMLEALEPLEVGADGLTLAPVFDPSPGEAENGPA